MKSVTFGICSPRSPLSWRNSSRFPFLNFTEEKKQRDIEEKRKYVLSFRESTLSIQVVVEELLI